MAGKEKKGDLIISRKSAGNIAKWNTKQKELKVAPEEASTSANVPTAPKASTLKVNTAPVAVQASSTQSVLVTLEHTHFAFRTGSDFFRSRQLSSRNLLRQPRLQPR